MFLMAEINLRIFNLKHTISTLFLITDCTYHRIRLFDTKMFFIARLCKSGIINIMSNAVMFNMFNGNQKNINEDIDFQTYSKKPKKQLLFVLKDIGLVVGLIAAAAFISFAFRSFGFHESNYIMTYILGVLLIAYLTKGYWYGVLASVLGVLTFNYFFTEPYFTLMAYSPEYPVTFVIMLIVAIVTSTLTARVKRETQRAESRGKRIQILYQIEKNLLAANNKPQLLKTAARDLSHLFDASVLACAANYKGELNMRCVEGKDSFDTDLEKKACLEAFQSGMPCGASTILLSDCRGYYLPVIGPSGILGVFGIALPANFYITESWKVFLDTIGAQVALALERERLYEKQQLVKMEIEREHMRGNLLRSISHDLRTPLTSIIGSASTMLENFDLLTDETKKDLLDGINEEAEWLRTLVENVLSMTRFDEGKIKLEKNMEAMEEIVAEAVSRVKKRAGRRTINVSMPKDNLIIPVDGMLIEQVLVNLLDNALRYTPEGTDITVSVKMSTFNILTEVSDNGPGIPEEELSVIFDRYYVKSKSESKMRRGVGLGLSICKSIVEAHGGTITAQKNPTGGSVFRFTLPIKE